MNDTLQKPSALHSNWVNVVLGVWIIISPFVLGFSHWIPIMWNNIATGGAICLLALARARSTYGPSGLVVLLGIWLLISPFVLIARLPNEAIWNDAILGIVVALVALTSSVRRPVHTTATHLPNP